MPPSVARTVMGMMLYLNYDNDRGFINEKPSQARDYSEYLSKANLKNWQLSDADLSLSVPILKPADGRPVPTFADFWNNEVALDYSSRRRQGDGAAAGHPGAVFRREIQGGIPR